MRHLLFDFGGVLVDLDKQRCINAFAELGFDIVPYLGTYQQGGFFSDMERGNISVDEFCDIIREKSGNANLTDEQIVGAWKRYLLDVPEERLEMLLRLKEKYTLHVLSNTNPVHWGMAVDDYFRYKGLQVGDFFDKIFLSCELGVEKPDPEIFEKVVEGIGCPPGDILFFDDSEVNCEAARKCGLQAVLAPANSAWLPTAEALLAE
ncbi:MAG: HAD family phosphatase [Bacteroidaceae bacterium]|nr:HAD family phosphatase [Bacteroidaceae bacterium]